MARMELVTCKECGKERYVQRAYFIKPYFTGLCQDCARRSRPHNKNPNWNGGRYKTQDGYIDIRLYPDDPYYSMASTHYHYCREHRYVMAKHLGRCLESKEWVHHKGIKFTDIRNRSDNRRENLELRTPHTHMTEHTRGYSDGYSKGYQDGLNQIKKEWGL